MFRDCLAGRTTALPAEGAGRSCALLVAQPAGSSGGWLFELQARLPDGLVVVRRVIITDAFRSATRIVATATIPGCTEWFVNIYPPPKGSDAPIRAALIASDETFGPELVDPELGEPGSKGWSYAAAAGAGVVSVPPGARVKEISAVGGLAPGSVTVTAPRDAVSSETLPALPIAPGEDFVFPKTTCEGLTGPASVAFVGTSKYCVAWLE